MEKIKKNKKTIIIALLILIVIAGVILTLTVGLNFDLRYQDTKKIELYIGKTFEYNDIKNIVNEVMPGQDNIIQKVEVFEDSVSIIAKDITDEQKTNIINKVNEKYCTPRRCGIKYVDFLEGRDILDSTDEKVYSKNYREVLPNPLPKRQDFCIMIKISVKKECPLCLI